MARHPYAKFARHVRRKLREDRRLKKVPNYQWCLHLVSRYIDKVGQTTKTERQTKQALFRMIQPIARLVHDLEGEFHVGRLPRDDLT